MGFKYLEDIKCFCCGGKDLEQQHILNGFTRCVCKTCGTKFLVQCEGSDIVDRYVTDRATVSAVMETASLDERELNEARSELKSLVSAYSAIVDIDPIYHWYKIVLLTNNFRDFNQYKEAEREYKKVSESYVISANDKTRTDAYERLYKDYCNEYANQQLRASGKKSKKKKLILSFSLIAILAAILAAILTVCLYFPVLKDEQTGIRIKLNNKAYGLFGKYSVTMSAESIGENTPKYNVVDAAISDLVVKYEVYEFNIYKDGIVAGPKSDVSVTVPLSEGYNREYIGVYNIDITGNYEEINNVSVSADSINFKTNKLNLFAVAERKIKVTFDPANGGAEVVKMVEWGDRVAEPAAPADKFGYIFDCWYNGEREYNFSLAVAQDLTLTAHWVRNPVYEGYTYVSTAGELKNVSANTSGLYLLVNDIDLGGAGWNVITSFKGTFDGGCHAVYNFKITADVQLEDFAANDRALGLFGKLTTSATVKNLQIGKEGTTTYIESAPWQSHVHAGLIAGYNAGNIVNCRVVNCSVSIKVSAQEDKDKNAEFASNVGGICGVVRGGTVSRCYVTGCNLKSQSWSRYNNISNVARCAGIVGYADNASVSDCLIENNSIVSNAQTHDSALFNKAGQPYTATGGVIGHALNTTIKRIVCVNNSLSSTKNVGAYSNGDGTVYCGCMIGYTNSTKPENLIGINTTQNPSGSNPSYSGFTKFSENSFSLLVGTYPAFNNGYWVKNGGKIALSFYGNVS